jgi:hypothetical protein
MKQWLSITIWHNSLEAYLIALAAVIGTMVGLLLVRKIMIRYFSRKARESDHDGYDFMLAVAQRTLFPLLLLVALYAGKGLLAIHAGVELWLTSAAVAAVVLQATLWANALVTFWLNRYQKQNRNLDPSRVTTMRAIHQKFETEGVVFAYPTRTIHLVENRAAGQNTAAEETHTETDALAHASQST